MHGRPGTTMFARPALTALALAMFASAVDAGDPPPFLPPSLQKIVEQARANEKAAEPREPRSDELFEDLRNVSSGDLTLGEVIDRLGSDDLAERERASELLANVAMWDEEILAKACELPEVCSERRARLRDAIYTRFLNSPRPAIGIRMAPGAESGIRVERLEAGFPAGKTLRANDEILVIGGVDLRPTKTDQGPLMAAIASFDPGDLVDVLVLREGREIELQIELGSWDDLNQQARARQNEVMRRALALRMHRKGYDLDSDTGRPIAAPVSRFDWKQASRRVVRPTQSVSLMSGGEASLVPGRPSGGMGAVNPSIALRAERAKNDFKQPADRQAMDREAIAKINAIDMQINSLTEKINDPRATEEERAALRETMRELTLHRRRLVLVATDPDR